MKKVGKYSLIGLAGSAVICLLILFWMFFIHSNLKEEKVIYIENGSSLRSIAQKLKDEKVIYSRKMFKILSYITGSEKSAKAGEYLFSEGASLWSANRVITQGKVFVYPLVIPEGMTNQQIYEIVENSDMLSGSITKRYSEGQLMPNTYYVVRGMNKDAVLEQMKTLMDYILDEEWENRAADLPYKNKQEALIMASIIEKETSVEKERKIVASVFVNRLKKGMKLQTDPTVVYAITNGYGNMKEKPLLKADLAVDSPYNTYKYYGLPVGPIANPGNASINAALNPEETEYLFFVADGTGGHKFSVDLKSHNSAVANWKKIKKR